MNEWLVWTWQSKFKGRSGSRVPVSAPNYLYCLHPARRAAWTPKFVTREQDDAGGRAATQRPTAFLIFLKYKNFSLLFMFFQNLILFFFFKHMSFYYILFLFKCYFISWVPVLSSFLTHCSFNTPVVFNVLEPVTQTSWIKSLLIGRSARVLAHHSNQTPVTPLFCASTGMTDGETQVCLALFTPEIHDVAHPHPWTMIPNIFYN